MISARDRLDILQKKNRNNPTWINRDLYPLLFNPSLHILAYERLKSKPGNLTPGTDHQTLDGYSQADIQKNIELLKTEHYQPSTTCLHPESERERATPGRRITPRQNHPGVCALDLGSHL